jgi:hypothetical protein
MTTAALSTFPPAPPRCKPRLTLTSVRDKVIERLCTLRRSIESGLSAGEAYNVLRAHLSQQRPHTEDPRRRQLREDARRLRAHVAATRERTAQEQARAASTREALADRVAGPRSARLRELAGRARRHDDSSARSDASELEG